MVEYLGAAVIRLGQAVVVDNDPPLCLIIQLREFDKAAYMGINDDEQALFCLLYTSDAADEL